MGFTDQSQTVQLLSPPSLHTNPGLLISRILITECPGSQALTGITTDGEEDEQQLELEHLGKDDQSKRRHIPGESDSSDAAARNSRANPVGYGQRGPPEPRHRAGQKE